MHNPLTPELTRDTIIAGYIMQVVYKFSCETPFTQNPDILYILIVHKYYHTNMSKVIILRIQNDVPNRQYIL